MSANSSASPSNKLPKKEAELFKSIVQAYETKAYPKGLKTAELILKKFPNHGETLAMKGLILNCLGRKEEGYDFVKIGLKNDLKSHVCWHVYGLLYRTDSNYKEATKCYLNALRIEPNSQNILRDLSWLQIQMRDYTGFIISRRRILEHKTTVRLHWVAFAVANFFGGYYSVAYDVISKYYESIGSADKGEKYEESELLLFQNLCLEKQSKYQEGLTHLENNMSLIVDKYAAKIKVAEYLLRVGDFSAAKEKWLSLVQYQSDNYRLHNGLQLAYLELSGDDLLTELFALKRLELASTTLELTAAQKAVLKDVYLGDAFSESKFQKSKVLTRVKLSFLEGEEFYTLLEQHVKQCLSDGIPALYHEFCSLVRAPVSEIGSGSGRRAQVPVTECCDFRSHPLVVRMRATLEKYIHNLTEHGTFDDAGTDVPSPSDTLSEVESAIDINQPNALLWTKFLYCHLLEKSGEINAALTVIEECIEHTPTALDMYLKKGKLLKKLFRNEEASAAVDFCRTMDLQDRYLNNKATKYQLRANQISTAMDTVAMFVRHDATSEKNDPQKTLSDLQCNWYECELAAAYSRCKQWGPALKKHYDILTHFTDYMEDMFDFHQYSARKTTLRMYVDVLAMQDSLYAHKFFQRAAVGAIQIYLYLTDFPEDLDGLGHLPAAERKKERAKLKKKKAAAAAATSTVTSGSGSTSSTAADTDTSGEKYLTKNFVQESADVWCHHMMPLVFKLDFDTLALMSEVYFRRAKPIQMLRCVSCGLKRSPYHPGLNVAFVKLWRRAYHLDNGPKFSLKEISVAAIKEEMEGIVLTRLASTAASTVTANTSSADKIQAYITELAVASTGQVSLPYLLSQARISLLMSSGKTLAAIKTTVAESLLTSMAEESFWTTTRGVTVATVLETLKLMSFEIKSESHAEQLKAILLKRFPGAAVFLPKAVDSANPTNEETSANNEEDS